MNDYRRQLHREHGIRHVVELPMSLIIQTEPITLYMVQMHAPDQHERNCPCQKCVEFVTGKKLPVGWETEVERQLRNIRRASNVPVSGA